MSFLAQSWFVGMLNVQTIDYIRGVAVYRRVRLCVPSPNREKTSMFRFYRASITKRTQNLMIKLHQRQRAVEYECPAACGLYLGVSPNTLGFSLAVFVHEYSRGPALVRCLARTKVGPRTTPE